MADPAGPATGDGLTGKIAFVSGGARGIGAAICQRLASDGATIAFSYSRSADDAERLVEALRARGNRALAIRSDSGDAAANREVVEEITRTFGHLDILVHNAGIAITKPLNEYSASDCDRSFAINVRSVLLTTQAAVPHMPAGGRVIVIGSAAALRAPFVGLSLYAASKAALIGLVKGLARDLGPSGISVNLVEPGPVDTDMNPADGAIAAAHIELMALKRYGRPEEVADLVAYLARPESALITGARLAIDGGFSV